MHRTTTLFAATLATSALAMTGDHVAPPFRGLYVPAKASCDAPVS